MSCDVCCEAFNRSTHMRIACPFCPFVACSTCHERYLCETSEDAHCMSCRKGWTRETLVDNFTSKFVTKTYKGRRENLLLERERSLLPATQPYVEIEKEIRALEREKQAKKAAVERANEKYHWLHNRPLAVIAAEHGLHLEFPASIIRHREALEQQKLVSCLHIDLQHIEWHQGILTGRLHGGDMERERRQFVRACPSTDCKGFLSTVWKCGLCDNWTCPECHEVKGKEKDGEHTCDPNNVATAKLLAKDSRNCPKCAASIFKIDGCDQMWCTQCHTAFSWRTGRVETHVIHNPHYYDYMRTHGGLARNPGDVPCGGMPNYRLIMDLTKNCERTVIVYIMNAHRVHGHLGWVVQRYDTNRAEDNRDLRIKLMIGDIDEAAFKQKIQQREKARQRKTDIRQVLEMFQTVLVDVFQAFTQTKDIEALRHSLDSLQEHVASTLSAVSKRYGKCAVPTITKNYVM